MKDSLMAEQNVLSRYPVLAEKLTALVEEYDWELVMAAFEELVVENTADE